MTDRPPLLLAFGDSLIAGYGLHPEEALPARIERRLQVRHPGTRVIDGGVSGDTTERASARLPTMLERMARRPDLALVQVGPNDVLRGVPPERTRAALDAILAALADDGIRVLLATVAPPVFLLRQTVRYAGIHAELAAKHGVSTIPFFPPGVLGHPDMVLRDRIHPNARAIEAVADHLMPTIERMLNAARR